MAHDTVSMRVEYLEARIAELEQKVEDLKGAIAVGLGQQWTPEQFNGRKRAKRVNSVG